MTRTRKIRSHFEGIYLHPPYYLIVKVETTSLPTAGIYKNRFLWKIIVILPPSPFRHSFEFPRDKRSAETV